MSSFKIVDTRLGSRKARDYSWTMIEVQLREYRARKAQEQVKKEYTHQPRIWTHLWKRNITTNDPNAAASSKNTSIREQKETSHANSLHDPKLRSGSLRLLVQGNSLPTRVVLLKVTLWFLLLALFIHVEFAAVYIVASFFYIIYSTLETHHKRLPGEPSAYSVFNPNCEQIDGTLTAAQFEQELKYRIGSVDE